MRSPYRIHRIIAFDGVSQPHRTWLSRVARFCDSGPRGSRLCIRRMAPSEFKTTVEVQPQGIFSHSACLLLRGRCLVWLSHSSMCSFWAPSKEPVQLGPTLPAPVIAGLVIALVAVVGSYLPAACDQHRSSPWRPTVRPAFTTGLQNGPSCAVLRSPGMMILTPGVMLNILFGPKAVLVGPTRILGLAVLFDVFLGFNGSFVASAGATRILVLATRSSVSR